VPDIGPDDHVRGIGAGPRAIVYLDLACPRCAGTWTEIRELPIELCVRHFPVAGKRPRAPALHAAAEAVSLQSEDGFWSFWDSLLEDRGHTDDPHLWERVGALGLDVDRFQADRRSDPVAERVRHDFRSGIRAGVVATPSGFAERRPLTGELAAALSALSSR
jgi:protein-disulfide isomerase